MQKHRKFIRLFSLQILQHNTIILIKIFLTLSFSISTRNFSMDYFCILCHDFRYSCIKGFRKGRRKTSGCRRWKLPTSSKDETQLPAESRHPSYIRGYQDLRFPFLSGANGTTSK